MKDITKILAAVQAAAIWHDGQKRKGLKAEPYLDHLLAVAALVSEVTDGPDMICAALLHDAIEDQEVPADLIAKMFGAGVAELVVQVTDDKSQSQAFNKEHQVSTAAVLPDRAKLLKLADKTANLISLYESPPVGWSKERALEYVAWSKRVIEAMGRDQLNPGLLAKFDAAAAAVTGNFAS